MRKARITIIKNTISELYQKLYDDELKFDWDELSSAEGKGKLRAVLKDLGAGNLGIVKMITLVDHYEQLSR